MATSGVKYRDNVWKARHRAGQKTSWNSAAVCAEIERVGGKIDGKIPYIVTDRDSTMQALVGKWV